MNRAFFFLLILALFISLEGCAATIAKIDGTTEEELKKFNMSKDQIEVEELKSENQKLRSRINVLKRAQEKSRELEKQIGTLKEQVEIERNEKSESVKKISELEAEKNEFERQVSGLEQEKNLLKKRVSNLELGKNIGKFGIKVLCGNGDIRSAKQIAERMKKMGYQIKMIDFAPRKTFKRHTIFFALNFGKEAERLVIDLGGETIAKPITWPSKFDFIVVTGKNP